jgi:hypothetical protein
VLYRRANISPTPESLHVLMQTYHSEDFKTVLQKLFACQEQYSFPDVGHYNCLIKLSTQGSLLFQR